MNNLANLALNAECQSTHIMLTVKEVYAKYANKITI